MVPGATGDAGHFTKAAEILSDEFTIITYDRRGNSRSTAGADRDGSATMSAQADDAAALIAACGLEKAIVFGTSGGAIITLEARHPASGTGERGGHP
ncbi:alpha/beta hydrolase [Pseudarthrobacter sp. Fe7]|nr:alpha/beta hydrolase [Pseudarthrobacter sp. Fe7]